MHWAGQFYVDTVLPFGLRSAPFIFNKFATALEWILQHHEIQFGLPTWMTFCWSHQHQRCVVLSSALPEHYAASWAFLLPTTNSTAPPPALDFLSCLTPVCCSQVVPPGRTFTRRLVDHLKQAGAAEAIQLSEDRGTCRSSMVATIFGALERKELLPRTFLHSPGPRRQ